MDTTLKKMERRDRERQEDSFNVFGRFVASALHKVPQNDGK